MDVTYIEIIHNYSISIRIIKAISMNLKSNFKFLKRSGVTCGLVFGIAVSGQALADCELDAGYELPEGVKFDEYCSFEEDSAPIIKNGKYGFIDRKGKMKIEPQYDLQIAFVEGLASVDKNGKSGYINTAGEVVIPFIYDITYPFDDGLAVVVKDNKQGVIDKKGRLLFL